MNYNIVKERPKQIHWNNVNLEYPIRNVPETGQSSFTKGYAFRVQPGILPVQKSSEVTKVKEYSHDHSVTAQLSRSQTSVDYGHKHVETRPIPKYTPCDENLYLYPSSRKLESIPVQNHCHGTTEMKSRYLKPTVPSRLVTNIDQYKHQASFMLDPNVEPDYHHHIPQIDTTHEGFEKYLDPYLTTSRLHHRPFTSNQLSRPSTSKDIVTYYTFANIPWVRTPKPSAGDWWLPRGRPKSMYDREKFKQDFREIIVHNKVSWVPGSFRTESRDNYASQLHSGIAVGEEQIKNVYHGMISNLPIKQDYEDASMKHNYNTEYTSMGSGRPLTAVIDQHVERNKRLEIRNTMNIK